MRLPPIHQQQYRAAIVQYLRFLKEPHQPATVASARAFMQRARLQHPLNLSLIDRWKEGVNWFLSRGRNSRPGRVWRAAVHRKRLAQPSGVTGNAAR